LIETSNWFQSNLLSLNCDKTHFLQLLTKKHNEIKIQIITSNSIITNINSIKFLGLIIESTLSWKNHITGLTSKLNKACYAIRAIKPFKIKKRIIRVITNTGRRDSCREIYKKLQILTFPSQYIFSLLVFVNEIRSCCLSNSEIHDINAHHNHNSHFTLYKSDLGAKSSSSFWK
jgi:hypothetical protein